MITVHHLENSRSQRVLWLLEELGLPYEIRRYRRDPQTLRAPEALRRVHPLGKAPVISDGGLTLAESGAIVQYLVERYGRGQLMPPHGSTERVHYTYWLHYAEGSAMPPLLMQLVFRRLPDSPMPGLLRPLVRRVCQRARAALVAPQLALHLDYMERALATSRWFAGDAFTAADIQMSFPLEAARAAGLLDDTHLALQGFLQRIESRPAYQRALDRGGAYDLTAL